MPPVSWEQLGPYRLCYELAQGGMGAVYLARDDRQAGAGRFVAIKRMLTEHHQSDELRKMFADEARIASRIRHPNVCSVLDYDADADSPYLVMELVGGQPLSRVFHALAHSPGVPAARRAALAARIIAEACEGLHAAHELRDETGRPLSVVHRDVSLDNLLVTYDGAVKVIDFGVVRADSKVHRTKTGMLKGKFAYIAPEVLEGHTADRRADVWGLGVVLWELLTLQRLFRRNSEIETLRAVSRLRVPPPSKLCPDLPPAVDAIALEALARDPRNRFRNARDLARALTRFTAAEGQAIGLTDLAELMHQLFPGGRTRHERLMRTAAQLEEAELTQLWRPSLTPELGRCSLPSGEIPTTVRKPVSSQPRSSKPPRRRPTLPLPLAEPAELPEPVDKVPTLVSAHLTPDRAYRISPRRPTRSRLRVPTSTLLAATAPQRRSSWLRSRLALALAAAVVTATAVGAVYARRADPAPAATTTTTERPMPTLPAPAASAISTVSAAQSELPLTLSR